MISYPFLVQRNIIIVCVTIHNYLQRTIVNDAIFNEFDFNNFGPKSTHNNNENSTSIEFRGYEI